MHDTDILRSLTRANKTVQMLGTMVKNRPSRSSSLGHASSIRFGLSSARESQERLSQVGLVESAGPPWSLRLLPFSNKRVFCSLLRVKFSDLYFH